MNPLRPHTTHRLLLAGCALWIALILLAPWAAAQNWTTAPYLYDAFHGICHQRPERSFEAFGHPLAVCHRCFGIYIGFSAGLLLLPYAGRACRWLRAHPRTLLLSAAPMLVDVFLPNTPLSRFMTGFIAAAPVALFVEIAVAQLADGSMRRRRA